eukprot:gnl/MRDRNA2_/MRDRNA2_69033_c0_seq2.p1 gnl/MRDRNA2_/MRDRNA2_69033_c0~~gnl/MRDRNA2_/MRDRNA2_69033_c0_seq2.p1  ORF type:complete len:142 (-),score=10.88 gnl/MRDRNA2_/MRDRNA2_69033_c0_seq2:107-532(-)
MSSLFAISVDLDQCQSSKPCYIEFGWLKFSVVHLQKLTNIKACSVLESWCNHLHTERKTLAGHTYRDSCDRQICKNDQTCPLKETHIWNLATIHCDQTSYLRLRMIMLECCGVCNWAEKNVIRLEKLSPLFFQLDPFILIA